MDRRWGNSSDTQFLPTKQDKHHQNEEGYERETQDRTLKKGFSKRLGRKEQEIRKGRGTKEVCTQLATEKLLESGGPSVTWQSGANENGRCGPSPWQVHLFFCP